MSEAPTGPSPHPTHRIVSRTEWLEERKQWLVKEKEFARLREAHARERRELPWVRIDKDYQFDTTDGRKAFADLFAGRSQLIVYHFMFGPNATEGCKHCSWWADHFDPMLIHLANRDVSLVAVSRGPLDKIQAFKARMGWVFPWVSSAGSDFNFDFHVSFTPEQVASGEAMYNYAPAPRPGDREGLSVFFRDTDNKLYHTYSTFARGIDWLNGTYQFLDYVPKGRDEDAGPQHWVRFHDRY